MIYDFPHECQFDFTAAALVVVLFSPLTHSLTFPLSLQVTLHIVVIGPRERERASKYLYADADVIELHSWNL